MSRKRKRAGGGRTARPARRELAVRIALGCAVAVIVVAGAMAIRSVGLDDHHPDVRAEAARPPVVPAARYAGYPRIEGTYRMAAAVPHVLDGLHCHCDCARYAGHHSLLDCFASDHGARCDICMSEAEIAYRMTRAGASLDAVRTEIDRFYGS